jgi:hypothetical protein
MDSRRTLNKVEPAQVVAETDALCQLWLLTFPGAGTTRDTFGSWLKEGLTFYEIGKLVHKVQRLHEKYNKSLTPKQLRTYFKQLAILELTGKTK